MRQDEIEGHPLSIEQRRAWSLGSGARAPAVRVTLAMGEPIDPRRLEEALARLWRRWEILRTHFVALPGMRVPLQAVAEGPPPPVRRAAPPVPPPIVDPARPPLVDCALGPEGRTLSLALPALVADPFSLRDLVGALGHAYARLVDDRQGDRQRVPAPPGGGVRRASWPPPDTDPPPSLQYVDYALWQAELLEGSESTSYWRSLDASLAEAASLPWRSALPHHRESIETEMDQVGTLRAAAGRARTDIGTLMHAALVALLWRLGDARTVLTWRRCDGRGPESLRGALGPFARCLPIPSAISDAHRLVDLVADLGRFEQAHRRHALAFDPDRHRGPPPDAGCLFALDDWTEVRWGMQPVEVVALDVVEEPAALALSALLTGQRLRLRLDVDGGALDRPAPRELLASYQLLLAALAGQPETALGAFPLVAIDGPPARPAGDVRPTLVPERFAAMAAAQGEAPAVVCAGDTLTFGECNRRANRLAHRLHALGVGAEDRVAVCLPRSPDLVASLLGVWKAGAAYLPLDPDLPAARLAFLLEDARAAALVTSGPPPVTVAGVRVIRLDQGALAAGQDDEPPVRLDPDGLAYVLHTSGSSGRPKGVMVQHGALAELASSLERTVYEGLGPRLGVGLNASFSFDASVKQLIQLGQGHTLHLLGDETRLDPGALAASLERHPLDVLDLTPTQLALLLHGDESLAASLPLLLVGGEAVDDRLWNRLARLPRGAFNVYGPTECTVDATVARVTAGATAPTLGRPLGHVRVYLLDRWLQRVPAGARGEIHIGGAGVARGYLGRPGWTAERFLPDPFARQPGARMYRTGDLARLDGGGDLMFAGRSDLQVKVRGVRVEPEEIEQTLGEHPAVDRAAVAVREQRLVAHVVLARRHAPVVEGHRRSVLPNGLAIAHQNGHETETLYRELFVDQCYLRHGVKLPSSGVILDVGANIGLFTLFARIHSPSLRVLAFEPLPPLYQLLAINCGLHGGDLLPFPFGLSDREETASFVFYDRYSLMSGRADYADAPGEREVVATFLRNQRARGDADAARLLEHADTLLDGRFAGQPRQVPLRRLSDVIREQGIDRIDLLKIDVQRAELDVLRGIDDPDWDRIEQLAMEVHDAPGGTTAGRSRQLAERLTARGFAVALDQDPLLGGTDRYLLHAWRPDRPVSPARADGALDPRSLAPVVTGAELRAHLERQLPPSLVPDQVLLVESLPLTTSGKLDRRALASLEPPAGEGARHRDPRNERERRIAALWAEVLRVDRVGVEDSFFDLGGDSMRLVQLHNRLTRSFGAGLSMLDLFRHPTVAAQAALLAAGSEEPAVDAAPAARRRIEAIGRERARALASKGES
jgi:amino acid adenylation domain-containing protein/FkbM family methyltransferase